MITKEQYEKARKDKGVAEELIRDFHRQEHDTFTKRLESGEPFVDKELRYAATALCPCGHGLAYPADCLDPHHYWDCSAILRGIADSGVEHTDRLPFSMYDVKSENDRRGTTRGVFKPRE